MPSPRENNLGSLGLEVRGWDHCVAKEELVLEWLGQLPTAQLGPDTFVPWAPVGSRRSHIDFLVALLSTHVQTGDGQVGAATKPFDSHVNAVPSAPLAEALGATASERTTLKRSLEVVDAVQSHPKRTQTQGLHGVQAPPPHRLEVRDGTNLGSGTLAPQPTGSVPIRHDASDSLGGEATEPAQPLLHPPHELFEPLWPYCPLQLSQPGQCSVGHRTPCQTRHHAISHVVTHLIREHRVTRAVHRIDKRKALVGCPRIKYVVDTCKACQRVAQWSAAELEEYRREHSGPSVCLRCYEFFRSLEALWRHLHTSPLCPNEEQRLAKSEKARVLYLAFASEHAAPTWTPPLAEASANAQAFRRAPTPAWTTASTFAPTPPCTTIWTPASSFTRIVAPSHVSAAAWTWPPAWAPHCSPTPFRAWTPALDMTTKTYPVMSEDWRSQGAPWNEDTRNEIGDCMALIQRTVADEAARGAEGCGLSWEQTRPTCVETAPLDWGATKSVHLPSDLYPGPFAGIVPDQTGNSQHPGISGLVGPAQAAAVSAIAQDIVDFRDGHVLASGFALPAASGDDWMQFVSIPD